MSADDILFRFERAFLDLMHKYLKAVDRVGTAPNSKSYKERVANERTLREAVKLKLTEVEQAITEDEDWLDEEATETEEDIEWQSPEETES